LLQAKSWALGDQKKEEAVQTRTKEFLEEKITKSHHSLREVLRSINL